MGNIAKVKKIMCKSSMPLEMTVAEFVEQASDTNWECFDGLKGLLTKDEIIDYFKRDSRVTLDDLKISWNVLISHLSGLTILKNFQI